MKCYTSILLMTLCLAAAGPRAIASQDIPVVLAFELTSVDGAGKDMVMEATQAVKFYLRETGRADVISFSPESPLIKRAIIEERLKTDDLVGASRLEGQLAIASSLEVPYILTGEVGYKDDKVTVKVVLTEVRSKRKWEEEGDAAASGPRVDLNKRNKSNAIQSAASSAISRMASDALNGIMPVTNPQPTETAPMPEPETMPQDAAAYARQGDAMMKSGNLASAIVSYRKAVNADPKNISYRIRLSRAYSERGMTDQAADELKRAQKISPASEDVRIALAKLYEDSGTPDKAAAVYQKQTQADPDNVDAWLNAGDLYWRQQKIDEAEEQYLSAVKVDPYDARPRERLLLLYAARGMFGESRSQAEQLQKLYANAGDPALLERYEKLKPIIDLQLKTLMGKIKENDERFRSKKVTREELYDLIKGISLRLDSMAKFLAVISVPEDKKPEMQRRRLAANLLSQAGYSLLSYLETNKPEAMSDFDMYLTQASVQMKEQQPGEDKQAG